MARKQRTSKISSQDFTARFWGRVSGTANDNGCWEWTGARYPVGYGKVHVPRATTDDRYRSDGTHRVAYRLACGPIPDGLSVLHHCDNRICCRPSHLFVGTRGDNFHDSVRKGRNGVGIKGLRPSMAKLTDEQVRQARAMARAGHQIKDIAALMGADPSGMSKTIKGLLYANVTDHDEEHA